LYFCKVQTRTNMCGRVRLNSAGTSNLKFEEWSPYPNKYRKNKTKFWIPRKLKESKLQRNVN
jgi:hypothetical protein